MYGFKVTSAPDKNSVVIDAKTIEWAWKKCASQGYKFGCLVFYVADGIIIKKQAPRTSIPPGAMSFNGVDQYCACLDTTQIVQMVFEEDGIIGALGKEFDAFWYSLQYHKALVEASNQTRPESTYKRNMPSFIHEALTKRRKKPNDFKDLFGEMGDDGRLYAMDPDNLEYYSPDEWAQYKYEQQQKTWDPSTDDPSTAAGFSTDDPSIPPFAKQEDDPSIAPFAKQEDDPSIPPFAKKEFLQ